MKFLIKSLNVIYLPIFYEMYLKYVGTTTMTNKTKNLKLYVVGRNGGVEYHPVLIHLHQRYKFF